MSGIDSTDVRLARVITRLNVGGPSHHVTILASRMGYLNGVLLAGRPEAREGSLEAEAEAAGARIARVPGLRRRVAPWDDLRALVWLYRYFRRHRPQIVATHMAKAGTLGRLAALWAGVPIRVHTFHGHILEGYFSRPVTAVYRWIECWLGRRTSHFIAISPEIASDIERLGIARGRVSVVRLGLDLERFAAPAAGNLRAGLGIAPNVPLVGIVGRLVPIKAHGLFLEAAAELLKEVPEAHFAIVGDGELWDALHAEVAARELGERVHFTGWRRDLELVYADLTVVVCCSINEGTPVTIIEAGAAGKPVVGTRVGGLVDLISDGVNGLLVTSGDAPALARALASIILDPERGRRFGEAGRQMALDTFGADRMIRELRDVYERLLRDSQPLKNRT